MLQQRQTFLNTVRAEVHFTEKLPHGPYCELGASTSTCSVYLPPDATVGLLKETVGNYVNDHFQQQAAALHKRGGTKLKDHVHIEQVSCKGGVVSSDDQALSALLDDGEALELSLKQVVSVSGCVVC